MLADKIHRVIAKEANLDYEGCRDRQLLDKGGWNLRWRVNIDLESDAWGRLTTYAIETPAGSGIVNGAAAHLNQLGDVVILAWFAYLPGREAGFHRPRVVFVDQDSNIIERPAERLGVSV
jgi:aspartate 1-decarboxylase